MHRNEKRKINPNERRERVVQLPPSAAVIVPSTATSLKATAIVITVISPRRRLALTIHTAHVHLTLLIPVSVATIAARDLHVVVVVRHVHRPLLTATRSHRRRWRNPSLEELCHGFWGRHRHRKLWIEGKLLWPTWRRRRRRRRLLWSMWLLMMRRWGWRGSLVRRYRIRHLW